jgi:hypothetical protein
MIRHTRKAFATGLVLATVLAFGVSAGAKGAKASDVIVLSGQGNDLDAYTGAPPFKHQTVIKTRASDPKGLDVNAQMCFFPDGHTFIAGEDTGQPDPIQGWGIFKLEGTKVGKLHATEIGKLQPTYQGAADNAENYGCGILSDGRVVTSDVGNQAEGDGDGQLIIWFPPFDAGYHKVAAGTLGKVSYCKLDIAIGTAGGIAVDSKDRLYVASARGDSAGVNRYTGPFPTSNDAKGGCGAKDSTGAPMADHVDKAPFIDTQNGLSTPNAIVPAPKHGWFVSSVISGVINEYDANGQFRRTVLQPPAGIDLGPEPLPTGTPLGLGVAPDGTLYFADIGIVVDSKGVGPGDKTGHVRRIRFVDGEPQKPEIMASGLAFPDGIGIYVPNG